VGEGEIIPITPPVCHPRWGWYPGSVQGCTCTLSFFRLWCGWYGSIFGQWTVPAGCGDLLLYGRQATRPIRSTASYPNHGETISPTPTAGVICRELQYGKDRQQQFQRQFFRYQQCGLGQGQCWSADAPSGYRPVRRRPSGLHEHRPLPCQG